jgi:hypothetical protein
VLPQQLLDQVLGDIIRSLEKAAESDHRITIPSPAYTGVANPVVSCEAIQVYMIRITEDNDPNSCGCGQMANIVATVSRDCGFLANDDGTDKPELVSEFSELMSLDGHVLASMASLYLDANWAVEFMLTGGIGITSLTLDMPIPC